MAVSKVRKLELVAHAECRDEILKTLRSLGAVHISDVKEILPESQTEYPAFLEHSLSQTKDRLTEILYCILFVEAFIPKSSFVENLLKAKPIFTPRELEDCLSNFDLERFHEECGSVETQVAQNDNQIEKKEALAEDLLQWLRLEAPLERIHDTPTTVITLGVCSVPACHPMLEELSQATPFHHAEVVERSRSFVSMVVVYSRDVEQTVTPILRKYGWRPVSFDGLTGTPAEEGDRLREEIRELRRRNEELRSYAARELAPAREKLLLLHDHYLQELSALEIQHNFLFTSRTFLVTGWLPANQEEKLKKRLGEVTEVVEVRCSDPAPGDRVPIVMENLPVVQPFSLITEMYGRPQYTEIDPTPLLAPFFALFFGICLGDAGYGLVLAVFSFVLLKKFEVRGGARSLLQILVAGGLASALVGFLTGGIFGINVVKLPPLFQQVMLFNPTEQVMQFLYIAFVLGVIQVLFGLSVKMANNLRQGNRAAAFLDQGLWQLFLLSLVPLGYKLLFAGEVPEKMLSFASKSALGLGVALVFTQGRNFKIFFLRPVMGVLKLYDTMGYFSDVLSYARLMALGLTTAFLALIINDLSASVLGLPYGIGYVAAALILVFGHTFNLLINCLSAFVHTLRLQYLEFFSKFYEGGGRPFQPFAEQRVYTVLRSDSG